MGLLALFPSLESVKVTKSVLALLLVRRCLGVLVPGRACSTAAGDGDEAVVVGLLSQTSGLQRSLPFRRRILGHEGVDGRLQGKTGWVTKAVMSKVSCAGISQRQTPGASRSRAYVESPRQAMRLACQPPTAQL